MNKLIISLLTFGLTLFVSCTDKTELKLISNVENPEWVADAVIYEVNIRQFTEEGTFNAFYNHLPRLNEMGVRILWFMPIHPIGEVERKGTLGSYYSIKNYKAVNPEFGTIEDFKRVVDKAHEFGMKVIIDWVANHTSRDAEWLNNNPEWYIIDSVTNKPVAPFDWTDVAKLDFNNQEMRVAMIDAMKFWIENADIDGFRCDVASEVPVDFWESAVKELYTINPALFMLAEAEDPSLQINAFNMYYGWRFHHIMNGIASGKYNTDTLRAYFSRDIHKFPNNTIPMNFTSNHDENSWNGTEFERLKDYTRQMAALTFVMPGMPLIYNGQEVGFNRRLEFFEKDIIDWKDSSDYTVFYKKLIDLRKENPALSAIKFNGLSEIKTSAPDKIFAFIREAGDNIVISIFNFSQESVDTKFLNSKMDFQLTEFFSGEKINFSDNIQMNPNSFKILIR